MTFDEYARECARSMNRSLDVTASLTNYALGLAGEAGEVIEPIKKYAFHGKMLDQASLAKELGDCVWYLAALANTLGLSFDEIASANIAKLKARYPEQFELGGGNR